MSNVMQGLHDLREQIDVMENLTRRQRWMPTNAYYTYLWLREDGTPYYVGKGKGMRGFQSNKHRVPCPNDPSRIIVQEHPSEGEALAAEEFLIAFYGRKLNETGCLRNWVSGGSKQVLTGCWDWDKIQSTLDEYLQETPEAPLDDLVKMVKKKFHLTQQDAQSAVEAFNPAYYGSVRYPDPTFDFEGVSMWQELVRSRNEDREIKKLAGEYREAFSSFKRQGRDIHALAAALTESL
jgi:hypothetical protein